MTEGFRCGLVVVLGRPNVGKSTLVNALVGEKVAIVSHKPQTTRSRIQGILSLPTSQIVLVDTPGLTDLRSVMHRAMRRVISQAAADADVSLVVAAIRRGEPVLDPLDEQVIAAAKKAASHVVVGLNKVDLIRFKPDLLPWIDLYVKACGAHAVVPVSALRNDGLTELVKEIEPLLPEGPALFPADMTTDQTERFLAAELVREQVLTQTYDEVPHGVAVQIEEFEDLRDQKAKPLCRLIGRIIVERESQKGILVGKNGDRIKAISAAARPQIEKLVGCQVFLRLTVAVNANWSKNEQALYEYGVGPGGRNT